MYQSDRENVILQINSILRSVVLNPGGKTFLIAVQMGADGIIKVMGDNLSPNESSPNPVPTAGHSLEFLGRRWKTEVDNPK